MPESDVVKESVREADLGPAPIPAEDVIEGEPVGETIVLRASSDATRANGVWQCTPGVFYLPHNYEETVTIIDGSATVTPEGGESVDLGPGDTAYFQEGTRVRWEVHNTLRKSWHIYDSTGELFSSGE